METTENNIGTEPKTQSTHTLNGDSANFLEGLGVSFDDDNEVLEEREDDTQEPEDNYIEDAEGVDDQDDDTPPPSSKQTEPKKQNSKKVNLKDIFGDDDDLKDFESTDKLKEAIKAYKEYQTKETEYKEKYAKYESIDAEKKAYYDYLASGGEPKTLLKFIDKDLEKLDHKTALKEGYMFSMSNQFKEQLKSGELTEEDLENEFEKNFEQKYGYDEEIASKLEIVAKKTALQKDAAAVIADFKEMKNSMLKSNVGKSQQEQLEEFFKNLNGEISQTKKMKFGEHEIEISDTKAVYDEAVRLLAGDKETPAIKNIVKASVLLKNYDSILKKAEETAYKKGKAEALKTMKNPQNNNNQYQNSGEENDDDKPLTPLEAMQKGLQKGTIKFISNK
jgi:hypothetical protein